jgi:PAS domain S-box-containing protein
MAPPFDDFLAAIVESSEDAIIGKDVNGIITSWNPAAERLFGYSAAEAIGCPIAILAPPDRADEMPAILARIRRGERVEPYDTVRRAKDGRLVPISLTVSPIRDEDGQVVGASKIARDISARKRTEEALRDADRRKNEFLAILAHELRNPLAAISNAVDLVRRAAGDLALIERARNVMERQLDQTVRLIDDLLDVSRVSRGKVQLRKERVELAAVIRSAVETTRPLIEAQTHQLTVTLPPQPIYVDADPTRLAQVVSNLLNNAAKYTPKGGQIWLTVARDGGRGARDETQKQDDSSLAPLPSSLAPHGLAPCPAPLTPRFVVVSIRDSGIGITAEHLPHIFEMFAQVEPVLERSVGGLGIGLALVRGLVEMHGGNVEARSGGKGKGSEFIIRLPVLDIQVQQPTKEPPNEKSVSSNPKRRILLVDDNRDTTKTMAMLLQLAGHDVRTAFDGHEAIDLAASFRPEVVLLDIGLPKMNGYEAARHIRTQPWGKSMALIALSGWGQESDKRRALEAGFDHHLTKPVTAASIEKLIAVLKPEPQE